MFKELVDETHTSSPRKVPQGVKEKNRADSTLGTFFFLRTQELSILIFRKSVREDRKLTWLSKDLLVKLKSKKEMHRQ